MAVPTVTVTDVADSAPQDIAANVTEEMPSAPRRCSVNVSSRVRTALLSCVSHLRAHKVAEADTAQVITHLKDIDKLLFEEAVGAKLAVKQLLLRQRGHEAVASYTASPDEGVAQQAWCTINRLCVNCSEGSDAMAFMVPQLMSWVRSLDSQAYIFDQQNGRRYQLMVFLSLFKSAVAQPLFLQHGVVFFTLGCLRSEMNEVGHDQRFPCALVFNTMLWQPLREAFVEAGGFQVLKDYVFKHESIDYTLQRAFLALVIICEKDTLWELKSKFGECIVHFCCTKLEGALEGLAIATQPQKEVASSGSIRVFWTPFDLLLPLCSISMLEDLHSKLLECNLIPMVLSCIDLVSSDSAITVRTLECATRVLWNLTFSELGKQALAKQPDGVDMIRGLLSHKDMANVARNCNGILFQMGHTRADVEVGKLASL